jgi:Sulfotransferase domain
LQWVKLSDNTTTQTGACVQQNMAVGKPPFQNCGDYNVFTDTGYATFKDAPPVRCYYPSIEALDATYKQFPNITVIMITRDTNKWYKSMEKWGEGTLLKRWKACNTTNMPNSNAKPQDFMRFYDWHNDNIRKFVSDKPSIKYIEVELESSETGDILEREVGIPSTCWAKCTPYSKYCVS